MLVFVVRGIVNLCNLCVYFSGFYFAAISGLSLLFPLPRCGFLYWVEIFRNGVTLCPLLRSSCFTSISLWGVYCVKESSAAPQVYSTASPSYANELILKRRLNRRGISCLLSVLDVPVSTRKLCASTCFRYDRPVVSMLGQT